MRHATNLYLSVLSFLAISLCSNAHALPYFRPLNYSAPVTVAGAMIDPTGLGNSQGAVLLPLITHSPKDGCLLPSVVCEDWTPLAVGGALNAGKLTFEVAPLANVAPWAVSGLLAVVPETWTGLRNILTGNSDSNVTFSGGPALQYSQLTNKGYFRVFTGLALTW